MSRSEIQPRIVRLLLKALESLEPDERSDVLECLISRGLSPEDAPLTGRGHPARLRFSVPIGVAPPLAAQRMFPVRLPERDHGRLKAWCDTHGFPMAAVVRGLIERFLDQREEPPT